jgi:hypothetical protein
VIPAFAKEILGSESSHSYVWASAGMPTNAVYVNGEKIFLPRSAASQASPHQLVRQSIMRRNEKGLSAFDTPRRPGSSIPEGRASPSHERPLYIGYRRMSGRRRQGLTSLQNYLWRDDRGFSWERQTPTGGLIRRQVKEEAVSARSC